MKIISLLLLIALSSCAINEKIYNVDIELNNGKKIERQYGLPDSIRMMIMEHKGRRFLVYTTSENDTIPTLLKTNVKSFKIN